MFKEKKQLEIALLCFVWKHWGENKTENVNVFLFDSQKLMVELKSSSTAFPEMWA